MDVINKGKISFAIIYFIIIRKSEDRPLQFPSQSASTLLIDNHQLNNLSLHHPFGWIPWSRGTTSDGSGAQSFPFMSFFFSIIVSLPLALAKTLTLLYPLLNSVLGNTPTFFYYLTSIFLWWLAQYDVPQSSIYSYGQYIFLIINVRLHPTQ